MTFVKKMQRHLIRSRAQIIDDDEKSSSFFCNLESYNYTSKIISKVKKDYGSIITDQNDILQEV